MLDELMKSFAQRMGVESTAEPILIDERKQGFMTYRFEIQPVTLHGREAIKFMATEFKGSGRSGRSRRSFVWPMHDPVVELRAMAKAILAATAPGVPVIDNRGWFVKLLENMTGARHINHIPILAEQSGPTRHWLDVTITADKYGSMVSLCENYKGRGPIWLRIPLASFEGLG